MLSMQRIMFSMPEIFVHQLNPVNSAEGNPHFMLVGASSNCGYVARSALTSAPGKKKVALTRCRIAGCRCRTT